jgi:hypothetical protein
MAKTSGVPLYTNFALIVTVGKVQKTVALFYAPDEVAAAKVARAYARTMSAAHKDPNQRFGKEALRLRRHEVGINK